jgi:hypothetical protein
MITDWISIGKKVSSIHENGTESGGNDYAQKALEEILGEEWIATTVEHAISFKPGSEVAMNCLRLLKSERGVLYAYNVYQSSTGERASQAVWLIKHIHHPTAFQWVNQFLNDENVADLGIGVLDQLLWCGDIQVDNTVAELLNKAEKVFEGGLKQHVDFIRKYLKERDERDRS